MKPRKLRTRRILAEVHFGAKQARRNLSRPGIRTLALTWPLGNLGAQHKSKKHNSRYERWREER